ncbi:MAG: alpha/beta fold hydrolase [Burkholderiales bacterium]|nr:alpha/beta fold hydrolase [Burkholderiales bacterium]
MPRLVADAPLAHLEWRPGWRHESRPERAAGAPAAAAGPLAVLLHGVGGGRQGFAHTGAALAGLGMRVLAADQPGYGHSASIEPYDIAGMAEAVRRLIVWAAGDDDGSALIVGHSMGGMVAQELMARTPQHASALVLAATSPAFGPADGAWQAEFLRSRFAPLDAGLGMPGLAAQLVPAMAGRDARAERLAEARALMAGVPEATYRRALAALVRFDRREALARIAVPTLVVTGEDDRTAAPEVARRMAARIAGAELAIVPGTGHLLMLEQPEAFDRVLLPFVARRVDAVRKE